MTLEEALDASAYNSAITEYNILYTAIDGTLFDGYDISTGEQGFPVREFRHVETRAELLETIKEMRLDGEDWEPVGEADS